MKCETIIIIETDDMRGDHAKDVELTMVLPDSTPIGELKDIARRHKLYSGTEATLRIVPNGEYKEKGEVEE